MKILFYCASIIGAIGLVVNYFTPILYFSGQTIIEKQIEQAELRLVSLVLMIGFGCLARIEELREKK